MKIIFLETRKKEENFDIKILIFFKVNGKNITKIKVSIKIL